MSRHRTLGPDDPDLTTPRHDAICCWLADNAEKVLQIRDEWDPAEVASAASRAFVNTGCSFAKTEAIKRGETLQALPLPERPRTTVARVTWERPIKTKRDFIVGYADIVVTPLESFLCGEWTADGPRWSVTREPGEHVWCEVKPSIRSLGELLRQLQTYRAHVSGSIMVVSPDTRHRERIVGQGFGFLEAPEL